MLLSSDLFQLTLKSPPSMIFELGCKLLILAISYIISNNCCSLLVLLLLVMYTLSIITFSPFILTLIPHNHFDLHAIGEIFAFTLLFHNIATPPCGFPAYVKSDESMAETQL